MSSFEFKFWENVDQSGTCWIWSGCTNRQGYGVTRHNGKPAKAHRVAYSFDNGAIPEGMVIDHICHNTSCVKPAHLRLATQKQNLENLGAVHSHNVTSGVRGVYHHRGKWQARVTHNGKIHSAGIHSTIALAEAAVIALRNELFTHNDLDRQQQPSE